MKQILELFLYEHPVALGGALALGPQSADAPAIAKANGIRMFAAPASAVAVHPELPVLGIATASRFIEPQPLAEHFGRAETPRRVLAGGQRE